MKRSILALAVLGAFAGAAVAQSSVTIYGKLDLGFVKASKDPALATTSTMEGIPANDKLALNQNASSRLGFRGTEDLGGGLRANFLMEHRFNPDDGQNTGGAANPLWQQVWLGLSGGFGELRLGRDYTPMFYIAGMADPWGYDTVARLGTQHNLLGLSPARYNNGISYKTANLSGFQALAMWAPKESAVPGAKDAYGLNVTYNAGPLALGAAYENAGSQQNATMVALGGAESQLYMVFAAYNFGFVRPTISYSSGTVENAAGTDVADRTNWSLGLTAPLGGGELKAAYAIRDNDTANTDIKKFGVGYHYPLSKRTKVYADVASAKETGRDRQTGFDFGLQTNF